ncbi:hypothetical protein L1987_17563 [Smallanthus sonchifolius]|uniref:Uncharacterized protein n=1 Tax=Smallanthus sonchifolius TaxID=185202 RepID=A0ACB9IXU6_9ASTR|nr:hypothetical protein L1987_17563 [Smallanthus sonchifolius]
MDDWMLDKKFKAPEKERKVASPSSSVSMYGGGEELTADVEVVGPDHGEAFIIHRTLTHPYAKQIQDYVSKNKDEIHVVLILQFGSLNTYKGRKNVSNAFDVTRLFINEPLDEISSFKKRPATETSSTHRSLGSSMLSLLEDDFLNKSDFTTIGEITEIKEVSTTLVTSDNVDESDDVDFKEVLVCKNEKCKKDTVAATPRYKIPIRVQDCTGTVSLTLFDHEAFKVLGISTRDVLEKHLEKFEVDVETVPTEFNILIDRKYAFKIEISAFCLENKIEEVYDLDESSSLSSTKPRTSDYKHGGNGDLTTLLVPKVEK